MNMLRVLAAIGNVTANLKRFRKYPILPGIIKMKPPTKAHRKRVLCRVLKISVCRFNLGLFLIPFRYIQRCFR